jgi:hypothetical protein
MGWFDCEYALELGVPLTHVNMVLLFDSTESQQFQQESSRDLWRGAGVGIAPAWVLGDGPPFAFEIPSCHLVELFRRCTAHVSDG